MNKPYIFSHHQYYAVDIFGKVQIADFIMPIFTVCDPASRFNGSNASIFDLIHLGFYKKIERKVPLVKNRKGKRKNN